MIEAEFWAIIEASRREMSATVRDGNMARQYELMRESLRRLSPQGVLDFRERFQACMDESYRHDLWDAAALIADGCSDDGFDYFRAWLISMGRSVFESALADPNTLAEPASAREVEGVFFEELLCLPEAVYEEMTGTTAPKLRGDWILQGERCHGEAALKSRFPRLWVKFREPPVER